MITPVVKTAQKEKAVHNRAGDNEEETERLCGMFISPSSVNRALCERNVTVSCAVSL